MSQQPREKPNDDKAEEFVKTLNQHGYPFHYRSLKAAVDAFHSRSSLWMFQASEFPVELRGKHTRIDYVLQRFPRSMHVPYPEVLSFLVVECKRANPRMKRWCFARAPQFTRAGGSVEELYLAESVLYQKTNGQFSADLYVMCNLPEKQTFHLAFEMKDRGEQGDREGRTGRAAIEDAATQVNLGLNGLIEYFKLNPPPTLSETRLVFFPIVLTTAHLYSTTANLSDASLETGELNPSSMALEEQKWIYYQYPVSPGLKHTIPQAKPESQVQNEIDLAMSLQQLYLRTLAIVQGKHIEEFLRLAPFRLP